MCPFCHFHFSLFPRTYFDIVLQVDDQKTVNQAWEGVGLTYTFDQGEVKGVGYVYKTMGIGVVLQ